MEPLHEALKDLLKQIREAENAPDVKKDPPAVWAFKACADTLEDLLREHGVPNEEA